jgi:hypothetical protein
LEHTLLFFVKVSIKEYARLLPRLLPRDAGVAPYPVRRHGTSRGPALGSSLAQDPRQIPCMEFKVKLDFENGDSGS